MLIGTSELLAYLQAYLAHVVGMFRRAVCACLSRGGLALRYREAQRAKSHFLEYQIRTG